MKYEVTVGEEVYIIEVNEDGQIIVDDEIVRVDFSSIGKSGLYSLLVNDESFEALVEQRDGMWQVLVKGTLYDVHVIDERLKRLQARSGKEQSGSGEVTAPMPGKIIAVPVSVGQEIELGTTLVILESMKMENELKAPRGGRIARIAVEPGQSVEQRQVLLVIE